MKQNNPKIVFLGTPEFAATILENLIMAGFDISAVYTKQDTFSGRNKKPKISEVKEIAIKYSLPVFQPKNKLELEEAIEREKPDLLIVAAYGLILTKKTLEIPKFGTLNVHGSILPKYRGASPVAAAILNGEQKTGISIINVTPGMDEGPVLKLQPYETIIGTQDTTDLLMKKMAILGSRAIIEAIPLWISGEVETIEQNHKEATYCKMIAKSDGIIDFDKSAEQIEREVRAFYPWPKSQLILDNNRYNILSVEPSDIAAPKGQLAIVEDRLVLGLGNGSLEILKIQPEGKNAMSAKDFINGNRNKI